MTNGNNSSPSTNYIMTLRDFKDIHTHRREEQEGGSLCSLPAEDVATGEVHPFSLQLHPWHLDEKSVCLFREVAAREADNPRWVAVGECGLDTLCRTERTLQEEGFRVALQCAKDYRKPVVIHCVKAWQRLGEVVCEVWGKKGAAAARDAGCELIIHGYNKGRELALQLLSAGFSLSAGERFRPELLSVVPSDRLYYETDESERSIEEIICRIKGQMPTV